MVIPIFSNISSLHFSHASENPFIAKIDDIPNHLEEYVGEYRGDYIYLKNYNDSNMGITHLFC